LGFRPKGEPERLRLGFGWGLVDVVGDLGFRVEGFLMTDGLDLAVVGERGFRAVVLGERLLWVIGGVGGVVAFNWRVTMS
jgi:hypothetical protein